ncbi:putative nucleotidyltransferase, Ribonuclease H [Helianthus annuus]|nr:putative nucleotidyltransferase, Ribonuclease H [Helianthus annuus]
MSPDEELMLKNIQRTFDSLRKVNLKLNPVKCSFGMEEGKFLGFIMTKEGFKVNLEKVEAIQRMPSPTSIKEMQRLAGRLAALNRFLANHAANSYPFISTLHNCVKKSQFQWTPEAVKAFQEMIECLIRLPTLTAPRKEEPLILYLCASDVAVGAVLLVERDGVQMPIYYISKMLTGSETRYSIMVIYHKSHDNLQSHLTAQGLVLCSHMSFLFVSPKQSNCTHANIVTKNIIY